MNSDILILYVLVAFVVIITLGPNVLLIISQSINFGMKEGLKTIFGTSLAMAIQLFIAGLGITSILLFVSDWFNIIKWLGVAYLVYLGISQLFQKTDKNIIKQVNTFSISKGFIVSATNPKQIIFFAAFIPQFLNPSQSAGFQVFILSLIYFIIAVVSDITYAYVASKISNARPNRTSTLNKISGGLLLSAAVLLGSLELNNLNKKA